MSNLSAGVQILVTQMKENPDAFFGPIDHDPYTPYVNPKFGSWRSAIEEEILGVEPNKERLRRALPATWFLSDEEKEALADAYLLAKRERFDAEIIYAMNKPQEEPQKAYQQVLTTGTSITSSNSLFGQIGMANTGVISNGSR